MASFKMISLIVFALVISQQQTGSAARIDSDAGAAPGGLAVLGSVEGADTKKTSKLEQEFQANLAHRIDNPLVAIAHDSEKVAEWQERLNQNLLTDMQRIFYEPQRRAKLNDDNYPLLAVSAEAAMVKLTHYALQLRGLTKADVMVMMLTHEHGDKGKSLINDTRLVMSKNLMDILVKRTIWRSLMLGKPIVERHMKRVHLLWKRYDDRPGVRAAIDGYYLRTAQDRLEPGAIVEDMRESWSYYNLELFKQGVDIEFEEGIKLVDRLVDTVLPPVDSTNHVQPTTSSPEDQVGREQAHLLEVYGERYMLRDVLAAQARVDAKLDPIAFDEHELGAVSMNEVYTYEEIMFYPRSVSASEMRPSNELSKLIIKRFPSAPAL